MKTSESLVVEAPLRAVYQAAQNILLWPSLLPHYRWVRVLSERGRRRCVEMAAHRDGFPCRWRSDQVLDPAGKTVYYKHTLGWSRGMEVWWILKSLGPRRTHIVLTHELNGKHPLLERLFYQPVVLHFFVDNIAHKTLRGLKSHLENPVHPSSPIPHP